MAGCYGSSKEDRYFESKLFDHLDSQEEAMNTDIEITEAEARLFLSVIGNMPAHWDEKNDTLDSMVSDEKEYDAIMKMYDRIHAIANGEE